MGFSVSIAVVRTLDHKLAGLERRDAARERSRAHIDEEDVLWWIGHEFLRQILENSVSGDSTNNSYYASIRSRSNRVVTHGVYM